MSMLDQLKAKTSSRLDQLVKSGSKQEYASDSRLWYPVRDEKTGTARATIRFLPNSQKDGLDSLGYVTWYQHGFKVNDKWYIDKCPTTFVDGKQVGTCPVCEDNSSVYKNYPKDVARSMTAGRTRKQRYVSNIIVINDPATPENEGKVFLFEYGNEIFKMILAKAKPEFDDEQPLVVDDFWSGCEFDFRIYKKDGNVKYDKSTWKNPSPLGSNEYIETIWDQCYSLEEYFKENIKFNPYEKMKARLDMVLGKKQQEKPSYNEEHDWEPSSPKTEMNDDDFDDLKALLD